MKLKIRINLTFTIHLNDENFKKRTENGMIHEGYLTWGTNEDLSASNSLNYKIM